MVIKAADEERRELTGIASTPSPDRSRDVVEPKGAKFRLPMPLLWQHDSQQPIGHVTSLVRGSDGLRMSAKLVAPTDDMPSAMVARLQEAWASIKSGLVRGLSIGFLPVDYDIKDDGGIHFKSYELFEISAVTIPANAEASIQAIKALDYAQLAKIASVPLKSASPAKHGAVKLLTASKR